MERSKIKMRQLEQEKYKLIVDLIRGVHSGHWINIKSNVSSRVELMKSSSTLTLIFILL